jgi:diguanylate cyclase (GGDEF)-like protein/PAS domain S-box-containing protein
VTVSLEELGRFCQADRAWIFRLADDGRRINHTHEWCADGIATQIDELQGFPIRDLPGFGAWIGDPAPLLIASVDSMPDEFASERAVLQSQDIRSLVATAMFVRNELYGLVGLDAVVEERQWPDQAVWALRACADIFGSALRRCEAEAALTMNEARFRAMFDNAADGVRVLDEQLRTVYASPAVERITGRSLEEITDPDARLAWVHPDDVDRMLELRDRRNLAFGKSILTQYRILHPSGRWVYIEEVFTNLMNDPAVRGLVINTRDVTERHRHETELLAQARRDHLTALPNRLLFEELVDAALARLALTDRQLAVVSIDLDRFKLINESLGHEVGDALLCEAARRVRSSVRGGDVVARLSGDEFVVLCEPVDDENEVRSLADRILEAFQAPFDVAGQRVYATASVGVALSGTTSLDRATLMRDADSALSAAKASGRNRLVVSSGALAENARHRLDVEAALRNALALEELRLYYQPIVDVDNGSVLGAEALLRWEHPERGILAPAAFLDIAEETGLIVPIGAWVIHEACRQLADWTPALGGRPFELHVNVSVRQLDDRGIAKPLVAALQQTGVDPQNLCIEITESALLAGADAASELEAVQRCGVQLALDDFGTGHSSLAYLRNLSVDTLKIDRQFVDGVHDDTHDRAIVNAILRLAESLDLDVVAEGVEGSEQVVALRALGCRRAQGFWYARPMPADEFERYMHSAGVPSRRER